MTCGICNLLNDKKNIVYEDEKVFVYVPLKSAVPGHVVIAPKTHYPILEQVPDPVIGHLFSVANKFSSIMFSLFQAQGTNVFVQNGTSAGQLMAHSVVHVLPRHQDDGLKLEWSPKEISEDELSTVSLLIKEKAEKIGEFEKEKPKPVEEKKEEELIAEKEDEVNYLIKQLERIP